MAKIESIKIRYRQSTNHTEIEYWRRSLATRVFMMDPEPYRAGSDVCNQVQEHLRKQGIENVLIESISAERALNINTDIIIVTGTVEIDPKYLMIHRLKGECDELTKIKQAFDNAFEREGELRFLYLPKKTEHLI